MVCLNRWHCMLSQILTVHWGIAGKKDGFGFASKLLGHDLRVGGNAGLRRVLDSL